MRNKILVIGCGRLGAAIANESFTKGDNVLVMFIGRLEIVPVYFAIYRATRDIFHKETV